MENKLIINTHIHKTLCETRDAIESTIVHTTTSIKLKCGDVMIDEGIIPLVLWIDSFVSVETYASCQGLNGVGAYVFFTANLEDIVQISRDLPVWYYDDKVILELGFNPVKPPSLPLLKYTLWFKDGDRFNRIIKKLISKSTK